MVVAGMVVVHFAMTAESNRNHGEREGDIGPWLDLNHGHCRIMKQLSDAGTPGQHYFNPQMVQETVLRLA